MEQVMNMLPVFIFMASIPIIGGAIVLLCKEDTSDETKPIAHPNDHGCSDRPQGYTNYR